MCFFLCLALPKNQASKLDAVSQIFDLIDASDWSLGKATLGNRKRDSAFLITAGGCSCFISDTESHRFGAPKLSILETFIRSLVQQLPSVSILIHYAEGDLSRERVKKKDRRLISFDEFRGQFNRLEFDVRYVIRGLLLKGP